MDIMKTLIKLQEQYNILNENEKVIKGGQNTDLLKKLKEGFDGVKEKYMENGKQLVEVKKRFETTGNEINLEKESLQEKEQQLLGLAPEQHKLIQEIYEAMEDSKAKVKVFEDESLELMEEEEKQTLEKESNRLELSSLKNGFYKQKVEITNNISKAQSNIVAVREVINKLSSKLPPPILSRFDDLIKIKGSAVVRLEEGTCTGCRMKVSSITIDNIYKKNDLIFCDNCGRILFFNIEDTKFPK